jgi:hypothetical protein
MRRFSTLGAVLSACVLFGCPKRNDSVPDASLTDASSNASASARGDSIDSVYAVDRNAPVLPVAERLCATLHDAQEKRRAECCGTTSGIVFATECTRMLSASLRAGAVSLSEADVESCTTAFARTLEGCDWVGPFPPDPPAACHGIVKGRVKAGAPCRSTLECEGTARCSGVGPTTQGRCASARADGESCGSATDPLASYLRQTSLDRERPECASGRCIQHRCSKPLDANSVCTLTSDCADGLQCLGAKSTGSAVRPAKAIERTCVAQPVPSSEGEACPGGVCGAGLECILGKCSSRKPKGAPCTHDLECRGGCLRADGGTKGTCGPRCDIR